MIVGRPLGSACRSSAWRPPRLPSTENGEEPENVLKHLHGHLNEDANSIRQFMAAQAKTIEE
jgi:hypothetical protein